MELKSVAIGKPADMNCILGHSHFIETVEDFSEAIVQTAPQMKFGIGFCESSEPALVRFAGNDPSLGELAQKNALTLSCGHAFIMLMGGGFSINFLNSVRTFLRCARSSALPRFPWKLLCGIRPGLWNHGCHRRSENAGH
jgi:adenosine/AMP kinase